MLPLDSEALGAGGGACGFVIVTGVWLDLGFLGVFKGHLPGRASEHAAGAVAHRWLVATEAAQCRPEVTRDVLEGGRSPEGQGRLRQMPSFDSYVGKTGKKYNKGPGPGNNQTSGPTEGYPGPIGQRGRNNKEVKEQLQEMVLVVATAIPPLGAGGGRGKRVSGSG